MNKKGTKWLERCKKEAHKGGKSKGNKGPRSNEVWRHELGEFGACGSVDSVVILSEVFYQHSIKV